MLNFVSKSVIRRDWQKLYMTPMRGSMEDIQAASWRTTLFPSLSGLWFPLTITNVPPSFLLPWTRAWSLTFTSHPSTLCYEFKKWPEVSQPYPSAPWQLHPHRGPRLSVPPHLFPGEAEPTQAPLSSFLSLVPAPNAPVLGTPWMIPAGWSSASCLLDTS